MGDRHEHLGEGRPAIRRVAQDAVRGNVGGSLRREATRHHEAFLTVDLEEAGRRTGSGLGQLRDIRGGRRKIEARRRIRRQVHGNGPHGEGASPAVKLPLAGLDR
ncbi:hypothetical protein D3C86_1277500 [compost metagenome]